LRIKVLVMAVVLAGLLFCLSASAVTTEPCCGTVPIQQLNYITSTSVCQFDPSLGTLQSVTVSVDACGYASRDLTNQDPIPVGVDYTAILNANLVATIPGIGDQNFQITTTDIFHLDPGETHTIQIGTQDEPQCDSNSFTLTAPSDIASYIGSGSVQIPVRTSSSIQVEGSTEWASEGSSFMGVQVCVVYEYLSPKCIKGSKVNDCTGEGLPGWTINLEDASGAVISTTTTGADGSYEFCNLLPGSYTVCEVMQAGWKNVGDICIPVTLDGTDDVEGVDFSNMPPFCISGHKFNNLDSSPLAGWTINLKDASGRVISTTTTGADGSYEFCGLFPGSYTVCEVMQAGWKSVGDTCKPVTLDCEDVTDVDFRNAKVNPGCSNRCPWHPVSELYRASCGVSLEVDASHGILANDPVGSTVLNPESITIDPKYGTLTVEEDGSFVYDPATQIASGTYVIFNYGANNGNCDSTGLGIAKIQVYCRR